MSQCDCYSFFKWSITGNRTQEFIFTLYNLSTLTDRRWRMFFLHSLPSSPNIELWTVPKTSFSVTDLSTALLLRFHWKHIYIYIYIYIYILSVSHFIRSPGLAYSSHLPPVCGFTLAGRQPLLWVLYTGSAQWESADRLLRFSFFKRNIGKLANRNNFF